jgi:hypothetical protein
MTVAGGDEPLRGLGGALMLLSPEDRIEVLETRIAELETLTVSLIDALRSVASWQSAVFISPDSIKH